ncbi:hypothetical protein MPSEU_000904200 [Mayamaea pseudoterrestris]|nr:hypothetical protein MPSEU_000904200 [Mayamaea pseudoterrestris]
MKATWTKPRLVDLHNLTIRQQHTTATKHKSLRLPPQTETNARNSQLSTMDLSIVNQLSSKRSMTADCECDCNASFATTTTMDIDSDDSSSESSADGKAGNRVRFCVDEHNRINEEIFVYDAVSQQAKRKVYLTQEQIGLKKRAARVYCHLFSRIHPEYLISIDCLFESPLRTPGKHEDLDMAEASAILAVSEARGMERHMSTLLMRHQRCAVRAVVSQFRNLRGNADYSPDEMGKLLRQRSLEFSRCTSKFGILLAKGDEEEAQMHTSCTTAPRVLMEMR